jgi:hypothetical protein
LHPLSNSIKLNRRELRSLKVPFSKSFCLRLDINVMKSQSSQIRLALVLGGIVVVAYLMSTYSAGKGFLPEGMEVFGQKLGGSSTNTPLSGRGPFPASPHDGGSNAQPSESLQSRHPSSQSTYSDSTLSTAELLPKGGLGASWAAVNPAGMGDLKGQNFLDAGYHTNTAIAGVSQTNRNASWDVRSETPNPQVKVGPFVNTTIEANPFKRGLEA